MSDTMKREKALNVFNVLCENLDDREWVYEKDEESLRIQCGVSGEDLPMELCITVDADRQIIILTSSLPFKVSEDKRLEMAVVVSIINNKLADGCFDYNIGKGFLGFRMTSSFVEREIGSSLFTYLLMCSAAVIDEYNDKLLMFSKGLISLEQFLDE